MKWRDLVSSVLAAHGRPGEQLNSINVGSVLCDCPSPPTLTVAIAVNRPKLGIRCERCGSQFAFDLRDGDA